MIRAAVLVAVMIAGPGFAQSLTFPSNARMTAEQGETLGSYAMPIGPWANDAIPTLQAEGRITRQSWRIDAAGLTSLQLIRPLRSQLRNDGFDVVFECTQEICGGFDFRFGLSVLPPPEMFVTLGNFRYLAARKDDLFISLIASPTAQAGFVQVTTVGANAPAATARGAAAVAVAPQSQVLGAPLGDQLDSVGRAILTGLAFETGSSRLGQGPFNALDDLAAYLLRAPNLTVALVGHTDSSGSLDGNIALSKRRAASVLERLVTDHGVPRSQVEAQGMGYLAPIASNQTEAGRTANRRVEVIITSTR